MQEALFDWNRGITRPATDLPPPPRSIRSELSAWKGEVLEFGRHARGVKVVDETLRDGLQNASGVNPPVSHKVDLLHAMARIGVNVVSVGLPAAGARHAEDCFILCREIRDQ